MTTKQPESTRLFALRQILSRPLVARVMLLTVITANTRAASLHVPNGSFETPSTDFVTNTFVGWQKSPHPFWYNDSLFPWDFLFGQFLNTSNGAPDHIDNIDGQQAAYLFAPLLLALAGAVVRRENDSRASEFFRFGQWPNLNPQQRLRLERCPG